MFLRPNGTIAIPVADGNTVRGDLYAPDHAFPPAIVFLCHGFKGYKTWGFFPYLAARLRDAGMVACALDFSLNGTFPDATERTRPGNSPAPSSTHPAATAPAPTGSSRRLPHAPQLPTRYPRPDLFRANTLAREVEDLAVALGVLRRDGLGGRVDPASSIGLFGHSRGGVSAMLNACESGRAQALCTWSTPDHPDRYTARQKSVWRRYGEYDFSDAIDGTRLSLSVAYLDDLETNHDRYDLRAHAAALDLPYLIVHGEMDLAVPVDCARALHEAGKDRESAGLLVLRAGHTFGVNDPPGMNADAPPRALAEAGAATVEWFDRHLVRGNRR